MNKITKITLSGVAIGSALVGGYCTFYVPNANNNATANSLNKNTTTNTNGTSTAKDNNAENNTTSNNQNASSTQTTSQYKDGTYTGKTVSTRRGNFQFSVTIEGGKITEVNAVTSPTDRDSKEINSAAIPNYVSQAISTQSSKVTLSSGATETYSGFTGSVQDALNQALNS